MENTEVRKEDNTHTHVVRKGKKEDTHGKHGKKTSIYTEEDRKEKRQARGVQGGSKTQK